MPCVVPVSRKNTTYSTYQAYIVNEKLSALQKRPLLSLLFFHAAKILRVMHELQDIILYIHIQ